MIKLTRVIERTVLGLVWMGHMMAFQMLLLLRRYIKGGLLCIGGVLFFAGLGLGILMAIEIGFGEAWGLFLLMPVGLCFNALAMAYDDLLTQLAPANVSLNFLD